MSKIVGTVCNICGKEFDAADKAEGFALYTKSGDGTEYNGLVINMDICCKCMSNLIKQCAVSPIVEDAAIAGVEQCRSKS